MIEISAPTPVEIEAVLVGMMDGTGAFARWVTLDDAHLPFGGEEARMSPTMWWVEVIGPDEVLCDCCGGGITPAEAAAAAWVQVCLGAWWYDATDERAEERPFRDLSREKYLSVPRRVPEGYRFELYAVPATIPGAEFIQ